MKSFPFVKSNGEIQSQVAVLQGLENAFRLLKNGRYVISITKETSRRTLNQNALFHKWMTILADEFGYTSMDDCKRDVKRKILGQIDFENKFTGQIEMRDFETSKMTTAEMGDFMNKVSIWASTEYGITLPELQDMLNQDFADNNL
ncbi:hypothetical protein Barb6_02349 [Bacteroidales bacterium Barb6]|nr:hypothetical protein Barb6_02349 [Bacteroidales bacterium Barb6]